MNRALEEISARYERANLDEHGPLAAGGFTAFYRANQGLPVSRIVPESESANEAAAAFYRDLLAQLNGVEDERLDNVDRTSYLVLRFAIERYLAETRYYWYGSPVTPYRSMLFLLRMVFQSFDVATDEGRERYFSVVRDAAACAHAAREKLSGQARRGIVLPKRAMPQIVAMHRSAATIENSPFLPGAQHLAALDPAARERFMRQAYETIEQSVTPAMTRLAAFLEDEYQPAATDAAGQSAYPGGADYYAHRVRMATTLDEPAAQIHAQGLAIVSQLRESMEQLRARANIDPKAFVPSRPEQIGEKLERFARLADAAMTPFFKGKPAAPFGVKRLPDDLAGGMAFGYYQPGAARGETGYYLYNGSNLPQRSLLSAAAFAVHELVPGHHYEINMARENESLPRFRAFQSIATYVAAYHEGWAEYAADLGHELGIYEDPVDRYGRYALDAFISSRLVVDTGINALGWSFERAEQYMRENTLLSDAEIHSEVLRYATDLPGQGLAYKTGSLTFRRLREKARSALGAAFDVREFHDRIVRGGGMPLPLVEREIDEFISERSFQ